MNSEDWVGKSVTLRIQRFGTPGAFLGPNVSAGAAGDGGPVVLLVGNEIPLGARVGDELTVFIYHDSEGRPIATVRRPLLELNDVTFLRATDCNRVGAFFDWGLAKELLVPFAEQTTDVRVGERYAVGLVRDRRGRLVGTMRVTELLHSDGEFALDEWVVGEAWRNDPDIGLFVIVEREFVALLPASEPHRLARGESARFRVARILPDGRIELSLRAHAHEEIADDARKILAVLDRAGAPRFGDGSSPERIRELFGTSRKAFKRALGRLLKEGHVAIDHDGYVVRRRTG